MAPPPVFLFHDSLYPSTIILASSKPPKSSYSSLNVRVFSFVTSENRIRPQSRGKKHFTDTHRKTWATVARFIEAKPKDCLQVPDVSSTTRRSALSHYGGSPASGASDPCPCPCLSGPGKPGSRDAELLYVSLPYVYIPSQGSAVLRPQPVTLGS